MTRGTENSVNTPQGARVRSAMPMGRRTTGGTRLLVRKSPPLRHARAQVQLTGSPGSRDEHAVPVEHRASRFGPRQHRRHLATMVGLVVEPEPTGSLVGRVGRVEPLQDPVELVEAVVADHQAS